MKSNKKKRESSKHRGGSRFFRVAYALFAGIVGVIFNIRVINPEKEPAKGGYLVAANHTSAVDPIVICYAFRSNQVHFMAKKELFRIPVLSPLIRAFGAFPVDRGGNDVGAIKRGVGYLQEGSCMGIFPQGHRYPGEDPRTTEVKNGAALICTRAQAPVVPVYIWRKSSKMRLFRRTYVIIGDIIPFESFEYNKDESGEYSRISAHIFDRICTLGEEFDASVKTKKNKKRADK